MDRRLRALLACVTAASLSACAIRSHTSALETATSASPPARATFSQTLEGTNARLSAALVQLAVAPSAAAHRRVATEYRRLGVLDAAYSHFQEASKLDPRGAEAYDGMARIWRDWGMARVGLKDAYRAVRYAPSSPAAANTLGTLLQATGELRLARQWYQHAVNLDPTAAYAINNVCYALILMQEPDAVPACERAVRAAPSDSAPRNNLALAFAAAGRMDKAVEQFRLAGDPSTARYNLGILLMATRDYRAAAKEFGAALQMNPEFTLAATRARQARQAADGGQGTR